MVIRCFWVHVLVLCSTAPLGGLPSMSLYCASVVTYLHVDVLLSKDCDYLCIEVYSFVKYTFSSENSYLRYLFTKG